MATVVSVNEIGRRLKQLGWDSVAVADIPNWLQEQRIAASDLVAYLDAAILAPAGWQDSTPNGAKITAALKQRGCVI